MTPGNVKTSHPSSLPLFTLGRRPGLHGRADLPVAPEKQKIARSPADLLPPPNASEALPVDRSEGLQRGRTEEKPSPMH